MLDMYALATKRDALHDHTDFKSLFSSLLELTVECRWVLEGYVSKNYLQRLGERAKDIDSLTARFNKLRCQFQDALTRSTAVTALESLQLLQRADRERLLLQLKCCDSARHGPVCDEGTRLDAIKQVTSWIDNRTPTVLWLNGPAGVGKSTLTNTIADRVRKLRDDGELYRLGAHIRCGRSGAVSPAHVIPSMAFYIATRVGSPHLADAIARVIEKNGDVLERSLKEQMELLLLQPLRSVKHLLDELCVVVLLDALDECGNKEERSELLEVLKDGFGEDLPFLRLVLTSRRLEDISLVFQSEQGTIATSISLDKDRTDVKHYLTRKLQKIRDEALPPSLTREAILSELSDRADGLFIWAETALKFIRASPRSRLLLILMEDERLYGEETLDSLYAMALDTAVSDAGSRDDIQQEILSLLGTVCVANHPPTATTIDWLIFADELGPRAYFLLGRLASVLDVPSKNDSIDSNGEIRLLHQSFYDFLTHESRSNRGSRAWFIDVGVHRKKYLMRLLQVATSIMSSMTFPPHEIESQLCADHINVPLTGGSDDIVTFPCRPLDAWDACFRCIGVIREACGMPGMETSKLAFRRFFTDVYFHWHYVALVSDSASPLREHYWHRERLLDILECYTRRVDRQEHQHTNSSDEDGCLLKIIRLAINYFGMVDNLDVGNWEPIAQSDTRRFMRPSSEFDDQILALKSGYDRKVANIIQPDSTKADPDRQDEEPINHVSNDEYVITRKSGAEWSWQFFDAIQFGSAWPDYAGRKRPHSSHKSHNDSEPDADERVLLYLCGSESSIGASIELDARGSGDTPILVTTDIEPVQAHTSTDDNMLTEHVELSELHSPATDSTTIQDNPVAFPADTAMIHPEAEGRVGLRLSVYWQNLKLTPMTVLIFVSLILNAVLAKLLYDVNRQGR